MIPCEYCGAELSTKSNLNTHQRTAKKCLKIQGKTNTEFSCKFCHKNFTQKHLLEDHGPKCTQKTVSEKSSQLDSAENELDKLKIKHEKVTLELTDVKNQLVKEEIDRLEVISELLAEQDKIKKLEQEIRGLKSEILDQKKLYENLQTKHLEKIEEIYDKHTDHTDKLQTAYFQEIKQSNLGIQQALVKLVEQGIKKPTTKNTIKNTANNTLTFEQAYQEKMEPLNLEKDHVKSRVKKLTIGDMLRGTDGYANGLKRHLLTDELNGLLYYCSDFNKKKFRFKDNEGNIREDQYCRTLIDKETYNFLIEHSKSTFKREIDGLTDYDERLKFDRCFSDLELGSEKFRKKLYTSLAGVTQLDKRSALIKRAS